MGRGITAEHPSGNPGIRALFALTRKHGECLQLQQADTRFCPPSLAAPHILFVFVSLGFERKPETFLSCCRFNAQMFRCKLSQPDWKRLFPTNAHLGRGSGWSLPFSHCLGACCLGTWNQSPCYTLCFWGSLLKLLPETSRSFNTVLRTCDDPFCRNADEDVRLGFYDGKPAECSYRVPSGIPNILPGHPLLEHRLFNLWPGVDGWGTQYAVSRMFFKTRNTSKQV